MDPLLDTVVDVKMRYRDYMVLLGREQECPECGAAVVPGGDYDGQGDDRPILVITTWRCRTLGCGWEASIWRDAVEGEAL